MSDLLGLAQLLALLWMGFSMGTALVVAVLYPRCLRPLFARLPAHKRSVRLGLLCVAPPLMGAILTGLCLAPSAIAMVWPELDHCFVHAHHKIHVCLVHWNGTSIRFFFWLPFVVLSMVAARRFGAALWRLGKAHRVLGNLERAASFDAQTRSFRLAVDAPVAFVGGVFRQTIFLSQGLSRRLSPQEFSLVLAHERAHVKRRDNFRRTVAVLLSVFHGPATRRVLLDDLELACEQASDNVVAPCELLRLQLAQTLLKLERITAQEPPVHTLLMASGASSHLELRVLALLEPIPSPSATLGRWWPPVVVLQAVALIEPLHHATDIVVSWLVH